MDAMVWMPATEISTYLRDACGLSLHWRSIDSLLKGDRTLTSRRKRQKRWEYRLLEAGRVAIPTLEESVNFIDPALALQATTKLHELLGGLIGNIRICDPYLDKSTVEHIEACGIGKKIQILASKVNDSGPLRRQLDSAKTSGYLIEVRICAARVLHDRYIIDDKSLLILGASLNGFGKKQSFVIKTGSDVRTTVLAAYDAIWNEASPLLL